MGYEVTRMTITTVKTAFPRNALWIAGVIAGLCAGCAGPSALEEDFGKSVRQMQYVQTYDKTTLLDPQLEPVVGMDGEAAANALQEYRKGVAKPEQITQGISIGITGGTGGGGQ